MATITVTATAVRMTKEVDAAFKHTTVCSTTVTRGQLVKLDTNGKWALADELDVDTPLYLAINDGLANSPVTGIQKGTVDLGLSALSGLAYGAPVYASGTDGVLEDSGTVIIGYVVGAGFESPYAKLLDVNTL